MKQPTLFALFVLSLAATARAQAPAELSPGEVRAAFLKRLDRPRVPLDVRVDRGEDVAKGLVAEHVSFASEAKAGGGVERVPALIVRGEGGASRRPAVIVLHGTGGNKEGLRDWLDALARKGFVAVAIDGRYHGERSGGAKGAEAYNRAIVRAWRSAPGEIQEHPFYYDTCWDVWRTIDYLQTRGDVDPGRIGLVGFSKGGIETYLAGAVDERVKVAIPAIGVQSFRWGLEHDGWKARAKTIAAASEEVAKDLGKSAVDVETCKKLWDKVVPGIYGEFDGPSMLRLFAGRPLLILNGEVDPNCPIAGVRIAVASAEAAYRDAGASDRLRVIVAEGIGHAVTDAQRTAALDWLVRWLKP